MQTSVKFLGHVISQAGLQTDPDKTAAIKSMPAPADVKGVQQVLGLLNYYRVFISDFAHIARPLTELLEKDRRFVWSDECQAAFDSLKARLSTAPVLALPCFDRRFVLDTDASAYAISGVLSQTGDDNREHPVSYFSRTLSKTERNYSTTRRELLAAVESMEHFRVYLIGRQFLLRTDHASIQWLARFKDANGQNARWQERLAEFEYEVQHRPGRYHANADALSRLCETSAILSDNLTSCDSFKRKIISEQKADNVLRVLRTWVESGARPDNHTASDLSRELRTYWAKFDALKMVDDALYIQVYENETESFGLKLLAPLSMRLELLQQFHAEPGAGGHFSGKKTAAKLAKRFYWLGLQNDAKSIDEKLLAIITLSLFLSNVAIRLNESTWT
jgi:hypothetical protein